MSIYKRGETYWFKFCSRGNWSASRPRPTLRPSPARRNAPGGGSSSWVTERVPLFAVAAKEWLASRSTLTPLGRVYYEQYSRKLAEEFGNRLVSDITIVDVAQLQAKSLGEGLSPRTVNCEVAILAADP